MSNEMLTETEWWLEICKKCATQSVNDILPSDAKIMFRLARQGMMPIPDAGGWKGWAEGTSGTKDSFQSWQAALAWAESSGRYIKVPEEWPDDKSIIGMVLLHTSLTKDRYPDEVPAYIPRPTPPKPKWEPKVGEVVLARMHKGYAWIAGKYQESFDGGHVYRGLNGYGVYEEFAPFDATKIGEVE